MKEEETMSLAIHPLNLGELETDFSTLLWLTNRGTHPNVPSTSWLMIVRDGKHILPTHDPEVYTLYPEGIE